MTGLPTGARPASAAPRRLMAVAAATATLLLGAAVAGAASGGTPASVPPDSSVDSDSGVGDVVPPDDLGSDPELDALAQECFDGQLMSCDLLFLHSPVDSAYEEYADTCAGRQPAGSGEYCELGQDGGPTDPTEPTDPADPTETVVTEPTDTVEGPDPSTVEPIPPTGLGTDPELDALAEECYAGDMVACDDLYFHPNAEPGSDYEIYGDTCAGRQPEGTGRICDLIENPVPGTVVDSTVPADETTTSTTTESTTAPAPPPTTTTSPAVPVPTASLPPLPSIPGPTTVPGVPTVPSTTLPGDTTVPGSIPPPTQEPTGLGDDPELNALAQQCYDGEMEACDDLYRRAADADAEVYVDYGDSCAGRQPLETNQWCVDSFPGDGTPVTTTLVPTPPTVPDTNVTVPATTLAGTGLPPGVPPIDLGTDLALDALAGSCYTGDMTACDALFDTAPVGSPYHQYGDTCGGRQAAGTFKYCRAAFPAAIEP